MTKSFVYKGKVITASTKTKAIQKIVADSKKPNVDMKVVNKWAKKNMNITDEGLGKDHWKNNGEVYYTWDAAVRLAKKVGGYHLPSAEEWNKLAEACGGVCSDSSARPGRKEYDKCEIIKKLLKIELVGTYREDGRFSGGNYSGFWTSTDFDNESAYYKLFGVGNSMVAHRHYKTMGLSVRLVKD